MTWCSAPWGAGGIANAHEATNSQVRQKEKGNSFDLSHLLGLSEAIGDGARAQSADEVRLLSSLGLDVIRQVVGVVAREVLAAGHGLIAGSREELLDVVLVVGVNNSRDVEVGQSLPAAEVDLTEHAGDVGIALLDGVPVALPGVRESDGGVLAGAGSDGVNVGAARVAGEVDGALSVVQGPEANAGSAGEGRGGNESSNRSSETHFDGFVCLRS